jgi:hypothetical protein
VVGGWRSASLEVGGIRQRSEVGSQRSEDRGQKITRPKAQLSSSFASFIRARCASVFAKTSTRQAASPAPPAVSATSGFPVSLVLSFVVKGGGKRKGIPLQTNEGQPNEGQPFLLGSQPYGVGFGVGGGTLDSNEVVDLG